MAEEAVSKEELSPRLYSRLQRAIDDEDDEKALELSQSLLDLSCDDQEALACKLVSLIHLSRFTTALSVIRERNKKSSSSLQYQFEESYCLYRQDKYQESLRVLSRLPRGQLRVGELQAQIAYKLGEYAHARATYQRLLGEEASGAERRANYYATASLGSSPMTLEGECSTETMEQCFNFACCRLASGCGQEAEELLSRAESLYRESLEEDGLSEEEVAEEMAVIQVQKGYSAQIQDKQKKALSCYNSVLKVRPDDPALMAVVANNLLVLNGDRDVFDSKKRVKVLVSEGGSQKLTRAQRSLILFNRCLFALQTNQLEQCRELTARLHEVQASDSALAVLADSALLCRERKTGPALQLLQNHLKACGAESAGVELHAVLAQLHLGQGDTLNACTTLRALPGYSRHVGVASVLVQLYLGAGLMEEALQVLEETLKYWLGNHDEDDKYHTLTSDLVLKVARFQLSHGQPEMAASVLEKLRDRVEEDDLRAMALLIAAYSQFNPQRAEEVSRSLPPFRTRRQLDIHMLEQVPMFRQTRGHRAAAVRMEVAAADITKDKKKRKRKPRLPKNYDPNVTPDPERWLPLRERSYYRKSRRKGGVSSIARGSQGTNVASATLMNQLDASKPAKTTAESTEVSVEGVVTTASPKATHKPASQAKKKTKKKKGSKW